MTIPAKYEAGVFKPLEDVKSTEGGPAKELRAGAVPSQLAEYSIRPDRADAVRMGVGLTGF
jgi:predicted DNA-binding antitoxin AbrB/MazE fold protein